MTSITFKGLLNFTNSQGTSGASSGNCLINSLINNEQQPMQEVRLQNAPLYSLMALPDCHLWACAVLRALQQVVC